MSGRLRKSLELGGLLEYTNTHISSGDFSTVILDEVKNNIPFYTMVFTVYTCHIGTDCASHVLLSPDHVTFSMSDELTRPSSLPSDPSYKSRESRLQFTPSYALVGVYRLASDSNLYRPIWDKVRHGTWRGVTIGLGWVLKTSVGNRKTCNTSAVRLS